MGALLSFSLGILIAVPPLMLVLSHLNDRKAFEFFGWLGTMCSAVIFYIVVL